LKKDIEEAERDYKKGDYITLEELMAKEGYVLDKKIKNKHSVSGNIAKTGKKKSRTNRR